MIDQPTDALLGKLFEWSTAGSNDLRVAATVAFAELVTELPNFFRSRLSVLHTIIMKNLQEREAFEVRLMALLLMAKLMEELVTKKDEITKFQTVLPLINPV